MIAMPKIRRDLSVTLIRPNFQPRNMPAKVDIVAITAVVTIPGQRCSKTELIAPTRTPSSTE